MSQTGRLSPGSPFQAIPRPLAEENGTVRGLPGTLLNAALYPGTIHPCEWTANYRSTHHLKMDIRPDTQCTAFEGFRRIASGNLIDVAVAARSVLDRGTDLPVLIFDDVTSELVEVDLRGKPAEVRRRLEASLSATAAPEPPPQGPRRPGRPKLGVVSREVTLLPRHWEWLNSQPGGASAALRKLVEQARRDNQENDLVRQAQEAAYRFMSAMAGDLPGFEEATRGLFAPSRSHFEESIASWPPDVRHHARKLAAAVFPDRHESPQTAEG